MMTRVFLGITILGALGAALTAALQLPPSILGGALTIAFAGFAAAAASAAIGLHAPDNLTEPREARGPSRAEPFPDDGIKRGVFGRMWFGVIGAFGVLALVPIVSLARKPGRSTHTGWRTGIRLVDDRERPIHRDHLVNGGIDTVFPQGAVDVPQSSAVLIRVDPKLVSASADGYLAFSKVCTHAGCPVALYLHASHELLCPCHQSAFDVLNAAKNVSGPAPRPLPQLALGVDNDGYLIAQGDFDAPVGPDDWDRTQ